MPEMDLGDGEKVCVEASEPTVVTLWIDTTEYNAYRQTAHMTLAQAERLAEAIYEAIRAAEELDAK